jgi:hypothetical protein
MPLASAAASIQTSMKFVHDAYQQPMARPLDAGSCSARASPFGAGASHVLELRYCLTLAIQGGSLRTSAPGLLVFEKAASA